MISAITGFLAALPEIIKMIQSFMGWVKHVSGNDTAGFLKKIGDCFDQLQQAKSEKEYQDSAKALADLLAGGRKSG